jgi:hypothetical protein
MNPPSPPPPDQRKAWNEAFDRLSYYLESFAVEDRAHVSRVALEIFDHARQIHSTDPARPPTSLTMELAQARLTEWLATNLDEKDPGAAHVLANGGIALLLSRVFRTAPDSFLDGPLPEELRLALREKMLVAGPDLKISRMTPRHLDYGPMLGLARHSWHLWNVREVFAAVLFWAAVYVLFYWWLSNYFL